MTQPTSGERPYHDVTLCDSFPGLCCILTIIGSHPGLVTPARLRMFDQVSCGRLVLGVKVTPAFVVASMCSTLKLVALSALDIDNLWQWLVESVNGWFPIFAQPFYANGEYGYYGKCILPTELVIRVLGLCTWFIIWYINNRCMLWFVTIGPPPFLFSYSSLLFCYSWLVMWSHHVITYVTYCSVTFIVCNPLSR